MTPTPANGIAILPRVGWITCHAFGHGGHARRHIHRGRSAAPPAPPLRGPVYMPAMTIQAASDRYAVIGKMPAPQVSQPLADTPFDTPNFYKRRIRRTVQSELDMTTRLQPWPELGARWLLGPLLAFAAIIGSQLHAQDNSNYQIAGSVAAYLGVMPAEIIAGHPASHPETLMHGGPPDTAHAEHIVIALFDDPSGIRIEDATVEATMSGMGHVAITPLTLDPMLIGGVITYGGYATFQDGDTYTIDLRISRPDTTTVTKMSFSYAHVGP